MDYGTAVYVGRFQPFHNGHLKVIEEGLKIAEQVVVIVGSANAAPSPKNPWSYDQRKKMILDSIGEPNYELPGIRVRVFGVRDYYYNMDAWLMDIQAKVDSVTKPGEPIALLGQFKDASSYYLKLFPQWEHVIVQTPVMNATDIRQDLFEGVTDRRDWEGKIPESERQPLPTGHRVCAMLPNPTWEFLKIYCQTRAYADMCKEWDFIKKYKEQWSSAPFVPTFNTVDSVVTTSGHVLVVQRKTNPGKGLYALPGGFLKPDEFTEDGALRELKEETGIRVDKAVLRGSIVGEHVFDHPDRSLRGRTISHAYHLKLRDGSLPEVTANDDASRAFWMPLWDVVKYEDRFFEDHAHIINYFVGAQGER